MTLAVRVKGGTGAGKRPPFQGEARPWVCPSQHWNSGYFATCSAPGCRHQRPKP